jgi:glycosyltransferase involved in cell wall biosynthesis
LKLRILLANKYWRPNGGVEVHALEVKKWLESLGHIVIPFATAEEDSLESPYSDYFPSPAEFRGGGIKKNLHAVARATVGLEPSRKVRRLIKSQAIDAAYTLHLYHQLGTRVLNVIAELDVPNVLSLHDYKVACPNYRLFSERTNKICTRCLDEPAAAHYAPILERCWDNSAAAGAALAAEAAVTHFRGSYRKPLVVTVLNELQRKSVLVAGVHPDRVRLVPHPVDLLEPSTALRKNEVLYVGRLVPEKGVDTLISACAASGQQLTIVGSGRDEVALKGLASKLNASVRFLGGVSHERVGELMNTAMVLAVPSVWHEVSPLVVYEAISRGLPVIGSNVGGIVDQLGDQRGYLVPAGDVSAWADALSNVANDPTGRADRSEQARKYALQHWSRSRWESNMVASFAAAGVDV